MLRRFISVLAMVGVLASQLAVLPHAHGGLTTADQQQHDTTPHFHFGQHCHSAHVHGHSHAGHRHAPVEQSHPERSKRFRSSDSQPLTNGLSGHDHDASAIYVPSQVVAPSSTSQTGSAATSQLAAVVSLKVGVNDGWPSIVSAPRWHPPDKVLDGSDTYLTLRNLRI